MHTLTTRRPGYSSLGKPSRIVCRRNRENVSERARKLVSVSGGVDKCNMKGGQSRRPIVWHLSGKSESPEERFLFRLD